MQASLRYQAQQLELPDFAICPDDPVEAQLASAIASISELKCGKDSLELKLLTTEREVEIKKQLLRNAEVRKQELQIQLMEYTGASFKSNRLHQTCDQSTDSTNVDTWKRIELMRGVLKSYASSFAKWAKVIEAREWVLASVKASYRQQLRQHFPGLSQASECPTQKP